MPYSIRLFRCFPLRCSVTYNAGPFLGQGTACTQPAIINVYLCPPEVGLYFIATEEYSPSQIHVMPYYAKAICWPSGLHAPLFSWPIHIA